MRQIKSSWINHRKLNIVAMRKGGIGVDRQHVLSSKFQKFHVIFHFLTLLNFTLRHNFREYSIKIGVDSCERGNLTCGFIVGVL